MLNTFINKWTFRPGTASVIRANVGNIFSTLKIIEKKWTGSVYKLIWKETILYIMVFYALRLIYILLDVAQKEKFLYIVEYCQRFGSTIPITLFLGFFFSAVLGRFFNLFALLPWTGSLSVLLTVHLKGRSDRPRMFRRNIIRYCNLSIIWVLCLISPIVKKRFPTILHFVEFGLMTENEFKKLNKIQSNYNLFYVPILWATKLVHKARQDRFISDDLASVNIIKKLIELYRSCIIMMQHDHIQLPLLYTQSVTLCFYAYFLSCLFSRQNIDKRSSSVELLFPFFTFLQFFFYMGWIKVAEEILNPFGEDDDDYNLNQLIDYNVSFSFLVVDSMHGIYPPLTKDVHWNETKVEIPYTLAAKNKYKKVKSNIFGPWGNRKLYNPGKSDNDKILFLEEIKIK